MTNNDSGGLFSCSNMCWIVGALIAIAAYLVLKGQLDFTVVVSLLLALAIGLGAALILKALFCQSVSQEMPAPQATPASTPVAERSAAPAATAEASRAAAEVASADAATPKSTAKSAAKKPAAKKTAPKTAPKPAAKSTGTATSASARKPVAKDGKPETLTKARSGGADDLKQIKGVGPGLEKTLNELGFYHFDQIAGWRKKEIEWVDSRLKFKGRIERDEWIKQAKKLAKDSGK